MSKVESLERQIKDLSADELTRFRIWFEDFDALAWDRQMEADVTAGRLDALADAALDDHAQGKTTKL